MPYIVFCNYIRIAFLIRCALRFMISCLLGMCSFIQGALCFIFSYFVFGHSDTILHPMCHRIYIFMSTSDVISTWNLVFYPMCPKFIFCLPHSDYVPLPDVSYALYCHAHPVCVILSYVSFPV